VAFSLMEEQATAVCRFRIPVVFTVQCKYSPNPSRIRLETQSTYLLGDAGANPA